MGKSLALLVATNSEREAKTERNEPNREILINTSFRPNNPHKTREKPQ